MEEKKPTVIVAEDEEFNLLYIEEVFATYNVNLLIASNGKQAVELAQQHPETVLILMDVKMPQMTGYEAANEIRKFNQTVPIVAQTAYALEHEIEQYGSSFNEYLTKPIYKDKLKKILTKYLQQ